jgi:hypothetical protein
MVPDPGAVMSFCIFMASRTRKLFDTWVDAREVDEVLKVLFR